MTHILEEVAAHLDEHAARIHPSDRTHHHIRDLASIVRAAIPAWQPIETAPKDGTKVLLADKNGYISTARWTEECERGGVDSSRDPGWKAYAIDDDSFYSCEYINPTHWMPLPAPPERTT